MTYVREVTKLTIITLGYIDYFCRYSYRPPWRSGYVRGFMYVDFEPMCPGFESRVLHFFFFFDFLIYLSFLCFFCHYYYSANLRIQHYCLYSVSPTLLLLMMPRPPAPSAL